MPVGLLTIDHTLLEFYDLPWQGYHMKFWNIIMMAMTGVTVASIVMATCGLIWIPYNPDLYNEVYKNVRLERPENSIIFFLWFPIMQILITFLFFKYSIKVKKNFIKFSVFPFILNIYFSFIQFNRLSKSIDHFFLI